MSQRDDRRRRMHQYLPKTLALTPEAIDRLDDEADRRGTSVSEFVRRALDCYWRNEAEFERLCPELKAKRSENMV